MSFKKEFLFTTLLLLVTFFFFELSSLDLFLQDYLYDFQKGAWLVSRNNNLLDLLFYSGFKKVLIGFALGLIVLLTVFYNKTSVRKKRRELLLVLLSILFVPLVVSTLKAVTDVPCPRDLSHYGGDHPFANVLKGYPKGFSHEERIRCYPAGHASGGFALMSLFFLFSSRRDKFLGLTLGLAAGWSTGFYKMAIGDHFLGHTLVTMVLAWWLILLMSRLVLKRQPQV